MTVMQLKQILINVPYDDIEVRVDVGDCNVVVRLASQVSITSRYVSRGPCELNNWEQDFVLENFLFLKSL